MLAGLTCYHLGIEQHEKLLETHPSTAQRLLHHTVAGWHSGASLDHAQLATVGTQILSRGQAMLLVTGQRTVSITQPD